MLATSAQHAIIFPILIGWPCGIESSLNPQKVLFGAECMVVNSFYLFYLLFIYFATKKLQCGKRKQIMTSTRDYALKVTWEKLPQL